MKNKKIIKITKKKKKKNANRKSLTISRHPVLDITIWNYMKCNDLRNLCLDEKIFALSTIPFSLYIFFILNCNIFTTARLLRIYNYQSRVQCIIHPARVFLHVLLSLYISPLKSVRIAVMKSQIKLQFSPISEPRRRRYRIY